MQIQIAKKTDYHDVINFIKLKYKKKNHILTRNKQIFDFFFTKNKKVNFVICKFNSNICGILGYLKNDHWGANCGKKDIWLGWWQVKKKVNGLLLIKYLIDFFKPNSYFLSFFVPKYKLRLLLLKINLYATIEDLIKIINSKARITIIGKRPGEKIHETLFTGQESNLIYEQKDLYLIYPENIGTSKRVGKRLSSEFKYVSNSKESLNISRIKKLIIDSKVLLLN
jgi:hypothetical protein